MYNIKDGQAVKIVESIRIHITGRGKDITTNSGIIQSTRLLSLTARLNKTDVNYSSFSHLDEM